MKVFVKQQHGFTLLELMLVLALVAALAVAALAAYQIQTRNFKVDKTAIQMQQWLQAGLAFYSDCNQFPDPAKQGDILQAMTGVDGHPITPAACPVLKQPEMKAYMPLGSDVNGPWIGNSYQIGMGTGTQSNLFQVSTTIYGASGSSLQALLTIGNLIAARLPNAIATPGNNLKNRLVTVTASVGQPGASGKGGGSSGSILNMQVFNAGDSTTIIMPPANNVWPNPADNPCPAGTTYTVVNAISNFQSGIRTYLGQKLKQGSYKVQYSPNVSSNNSIIPMLNVTGDCNSGECNNTGAGTNSGNKILLIAACVPNSTTTNNATQASTGNSGSINRY